ncbi:MAG TPA: ABC transporter permease [Chryseosolibacter sp.]|nr:ABC transporter permease [Chryseosolibacter sp.]
MNLWLLVWSYLKARPLNTALNILILGLGVAVVTILIIVNYQLRDNISANARGIDLVVGAKGSPMQLILSNIFHVDFPTGNISLAEAERIARNRLVKKAIPMALGDSYQGFRIVGTTRDYAALYDARLREGAWPEKPMQVALGASVARALDLKIGDHFASSHGLNQSGPAHDQQFVVTGIANPTRSVLDNLILTTVESVWKVHEDHGAQATVIEEHAANASDGPLSSLIPSVPAGDSTKEITSLLIQYRSAMGAIQMPRWVNGQSALQAASPAFETARLFSILGVGVDVIRGFAYILIFVSALSIFIALYNSLKERRYDLAIMRSMGASRFRIFFSVLLEGLALTFLGACVGLALAHFVLLLAGTFMPEAGSIGLSALRFYPEEVIILAVSLLLGLICAFMPAIQAYRTDISRVLAAS